MNELARCVIESLRSSRPNAEALARAGSARPAEDAQALAEAAADPDLAPHLETWTPVLLCTAMPGAGARHLAAIAAARRHAGASGPWGGLALLTSVLGNSRFLARWLTREPGWLEDFDGPLPPPPPAPPDAAGWSELRRTKYRGLLRVAARDLSERPFEASLSELSELADGILRRGLALAAGSDEAPALFALGKLGGSELNFSSDVDLLFVCDAEPDASGDAARATAHRIVLELARRLEEPSEDGFGYRVDLDLRPEGPAGALVRGPEATLTYYEIRGAEWERQMLLRLRLLAGSERAARDFETGIEPFVYRRAIDPGVIDSVRAMKQRIERERREDGRDLEANLKESPGGIRDVEFTVQALQLFYAGRRPELRTGNVLAAIGSLAAAGLLPEDSAHALAEGYLWLRRAEHALQLAEEQQTAQLPASAADRLELARRMGYVDVEGAEALRRFESDLDGTRARVREHFDALVLKGSSE